MRRTIVVFLLILGVALVAGVSYILKITFFHTSGIAETAVRLDLISDTLPPGAVARIGSIRLRHGGPVHSLAFSRDGKRICATDEYGVGVWDAKNGGCISFRMLPQGHASVISHDGVWVAYSHWNRAIVLEDTASGKKIFELPHEGLHYRISFSKDRKWLASISRKGMVCVWDLQSRKLHCQWKSFTPIGQIDECHNAFTPDGKTLVHATWPGQLVFFDVQSKKELFRPPSRWHYQSLHGIAISPDGQILATMSGERRLEFWQVKTGNFLFEVVADHHRFGPRFSPNGKYLAWGNEKGNVVCATPLSGAWDGAKPLYRRLLRGEPPNFTHRLAFSPDGKRLACGGSDHAIHVWNLDTDRRVFLNKMNLRGEVYAKFVKGQNVLLSRCTHDIYYYESKVNDQIDFWNLEGKSVRHAKFNAKGVHHFSISPDATTLALAAGDQCGNGRRNRSPRSALTLRNLRNGKDFLELDNLPCELNQLQFSPCGRYLFTWVNKAGRNDSHRASKAYVQIWKRELPAKLQLVHEISARYPTRLDGKEIWVLCAPDGQWLGVPTSPGWNFYWCDSGKLFRSYPKLTDSNAGWRSKLPLMATSPTGRVIVCSAYGERPPCLVELSTGRIFRKLQCAPEEIDNGQFVVSPDGKIIAGDLCTPTVFLWDFHTGKQLARLDGHRGEICSLCFSPDGRFLVSGSTDTTILIWDYRKMHAAPASEKTVLSRKRLEQIWHDLQNIDPQFGYDAVSTLVRAQAQAVPFLKRKLQPSTTKDLFKIQDWIADLDNDDFRKRNQAMSRIAGQGALAEPLLRQVVKKPPSLEACLRAQAVLDRIRKPDSGGAWLGNTRGVEILELIGTPEARQHVEHLTTGLSKAPLTQEAIRTLQRMTKRMRLLSRTQIQ